MKKNIVLTAVLSAMLLTGCSKETEFIDDFETSGITVSSQLTQTAETEGKTQYIFGGETETSAAENENPETEITENMHLFDFGKLNVETQNEGVSVDTLGSFVNGNICCTFCEIKSEQEHIRYILRIYNIESETVEKTIRITGSNEFVEFLGGDNDNLCKVKLIQGGSKWDTYSVMTVKKDYSFEYSEYTTQTAALHRGGHNITQWYNDIIDADSGVKIVEGFESDGDSYRLETLRSQEYMFPIDEYRFVYRTAGYESMPCFGIYDFETDAAADVPDSENLLPIGVHNGKVYSVKTAWDGFGTELYTTDIETLETDFFMDYPFELEQNAYVSYAMSEDGKHIAVLKSGYEVPKAVYIIDPDTAEITAENEITYDFQYHSGISFADNSTVVIQNWSDKILIIDIE